MIKYMWTPSSPPPSVTVCMIFFMTSACLATKQNYKPVCTGFHSNTVAHSALLVCDTVLLYEWFLTFWRFTVPSSSRIKVSMHIQGHNVRRSKPNLLARVNRSHRWSRKVGMSLHCYCLLGMVLTYIFIHLFYSQGFTILKEQHSFNFITFHMHYYCLLINNFPLMFGLPHHIQTATDEVFDSICHT